MTGVAGPLQGVRVLDLTHVWAGPLAVRFLADFGAEVVKIEAPFGRGGQTPAYEPLGGWLGGAPGSEPWNNNALFCKLHRNRKSVCVDLKSSEGRGLFLELVRCADVLVENFSAAAMAGMGLDADVLAQTNARLIYLTMPGFGSTGPYAQRVAFGPVVEAMSGLSTVLGYGPEAPHNSALALMDPVAATHAAAAVCEALRTRQATGNGARIELSLHEGGVTFCGPWLLDTQMGQPPQPMGNRHPHMSPQGIYACQGDDQWVAVTCADDHQWQGLCSLIEELDPTWDVQARVQHADQIDTALSLFTADKTKTQAAQILQGVGVAAGPVNTTPDMTADPHVQQRGFFVPYERFATPMPGNPIHMTGLDSTQWQPCPGLGEHNREVLQTWLAIPAQEVDRLLAAGVLLDRPPD